MMPTGAGKSLCFQVPALVFEQIDPVQPRPLTIVLSPLIALMKDQVDVLVTKGISATYINSSLSADERNRRYAELADGQWSLLYVTPERFRKEEFLKVLVGVVAFRSGGGRSALHQRMGGTIFGPTIHA